MHQPKPLNRNQVQPSPFNRNRHQPKPTEPLSSNSVLAHFRNQYTEIGPSETEIEFFSKSLFRITAKFDLRRFNGWSSDPKILFNEFGKLYFNMARRLVGGHLHRKRWRQPLTYAFIDFKGSKVSGAIDAENSEMPHLHGVMLLRPEYRTKFEMINLPFLAEIVTPRINNVLLERYDPNRGSLENYISYCSKGYEQSYRSYRARDDLWALYPW